MAGLLTDNYIHSLWEIANSLASCSNIFQQKMFVPAEKVELICGELIKHRRAASVPADAFPVGTLVSKVGGDYQFDGVVVSAFTKKSGAVRLVVEDDRGVLHIFSQKNLTRRV